MVAEASRFMTIGADLARAPIGLVALLSVALLVNYVDRGSIATAAPLLEQELGLSASQMGWVLAAFYWAYAPMQPVMGWLADRYGPARVLSGGFLLWSLATAANGLAGGLVMLVLLRMLMGVGEATFYPSALSLLSRRVPPLQRARATATMQFGAVVGPAIGTLLGGLLMVRYGWRAMFIVMGLASLRLAHCVAALDAPLPRAPVPRANAGENPPYALILRQRALWGGMMGTFCSNYAFYFVFSWLPLYLVHERGLSLAMMTQAASAFYVVDGASVLLTGWLLDRWIRRGASFNRAYKTALALSSAGVGALPDRQQPRERARRRGRDPAADRPHGRAQQPGQSVRDADVRGSVGDGSLDGDPERRRQRRGDDGARRDRLSRAAHGPLHFGTHRVRCRGIVRARGMAGRRPGSPSDRLVGRNRPARPPLIIAQHAPNL